MDNTHITFSPMKKKDLDLWNTWIAQSHVKDVWFIEGYETCDYIHQKISGNGYDHPFIIYLNNTPIGYIQCTDLYTYRKNCQNPKGLFTQEEEGTWCIDLFIGDTDYINKGIGAKIVKTFTKKLFTEFSTKTILIDPASSNKQAIRCYQKAGFKFVKTEHDGVTECSIMKISKEQYRQQDFRIRTATKNDLKTIIALLADDPFAKSREQVSDSPSQSYINAIDEIIKDNSAELLVMDHSSKVIGVAQINYIRYLTFQGGLRAQIEGVRIDKEYRSQGLGAIFFNHLIERAKLKKCHVVQLATDKKRPKALKFYETMGFKATHHGLKLHLPTNK